MNSCFRKSLQTLADPLRTAIMSISEDAHSISLLNAHQVAALQAKTGMSERALAEALLPLAASFAVVPISSFPVGAISHGKSGTWYFGANQEFAGLPLNQTVHAEQSAIVHAWSQRESEVTAITVNYSPCGHCRQFINELHNSQSILLQLPDRGVMTLTDYLPDAFGPRDLGITAALLQHPQQSVKISGDPLEQAAKLAACRSYAPYSHSYSGVALLTQNNQIFSGSYAENAAFNPSLSPLQAAFTTLNLAGYEFRDITDVVLAESQSAQISQAGMCNEILAALECPTARRVFI